MTTTEVLMLNGGGFKLETLSEKTSLNLGSDERTQHTISKLGNTHPKICDNKAMCRMQPMADHFAKIKFGRFIVATIRKNKVSLSVWRLYKLE